MLFSFLRVLKVAFGYIVLKGRRRELITSLLSFSIFFLLRTLLCDQSVLKSLLSRIFQLFELILLSKLLVLSVCLLLLPFLNSAPLFLLLLALSNFFFPFYLLQPSLLIELAVFLCFCFGHLGYLSLLVPDLLIDVFHAFSLCCRFIIFFLLLSQLVSSLPL